MKVIYSGKARTAIEAPGRDGPVPLIPNATVDLPDDMPFVKRGLNNGLFKRLEVAPVKSSAKKATKKGESDD